MAFKTFVDGVALPASDLNTYLMRQSVIVCTSGTRPAAPLEGQQIYETDTDRMLTYTTATTTWRQPWNMPWGRLTHASSTTTQTGIGTTETDVTGMSVTFTAVTNRYYKISGHLLVTGGPNTITGTITNSSNVGQNAATISFLGGAGFASLSPWVILAITAGSVTYKLRLVTSTGTVDTIPAAGRPHLLLVEDIGPNGAPA